MSSNSKPGYIQRDRIRFRLEGGRLRPERLGIIGLGAIGGSVAWAATRAGVSRVVGYTASSEDGSQAARAGAVTSIAASPGEVIADVDLVVLAAPPRANLSLLDQLQEVLRETGVPVTDVTSVQLPFLDKAVVYLSDIDAGDETKELVADLWRFLGASPVTVDAVWHDQVVAWTSHLPQVISTVLAVTLGSDTPTDGMMGSGALDTTRLAGSSVEMWKDLMSLNQEQILRALESFERRLRLMKDSLQRGDAEEIATWFQKGVEFRNGLLP